MSGLSARKTVSKSVFVSYLLLPPDAHRGACKSQSPQSPFAVVSAGREQVPHCGCSFVWAVRVMQCSDSESSPRCFGCIVAALGPAQGPHCGCSYELVEPAPASNQQAEHWNLARNLMLVPVVSAVVPSGRRPTGLMMVLYHCASIQRRMVL
jgi:hypothetical protein